MDKLELAMIATEVEIPRAVTYLPGASLRRRDRLAELADWWATVRGGSGAEAPGRVAHLWSRVPGSAPPAAAQLRIGRLDPPNDVHGAIDWGVATADDAADDGTDLLLVSVPDLDWQVLAAYLIGLDAVEAIGWPRVTGLKDGDWMVRVAAIRDGLRGLRSTVEQPERMLTQLGSPAIAAGTGLLLRAAARRTPCLLDGPGALACALLANRLSGAAAAWWQAADSGVGTLTDRMLSELGLSPLTRFGLTAEDGTAGRIALHLLETAVARAAEQATHPVEEDDDAAGLLTADDVEDAT